MAAAMVAALVLAGGRARRLGGADKPGIAIGGRPMVSAVAAAAAGAGAGHLVLVGPPRPGLSGELAAHGHQVVVEFTTEQPPGAGPVPALRAGLQLIGARWVFLLAADLPFLRDSHLRALLRAGQQSGGAMLVDDQGRAQWLASCWRTADLAAALAGYQGSALGGVLGPLCPVEVTVVPDQAPPWLDCDTPQDVAAARAADQRQRRKADDEHPR